MKHGKDDRRMNSLKKLKALPKQAFDLLCAEVASARVDVRRPDRVGARSEGGGSLLQPACHALSARRRGRSGERPRAGERVGSAL